MESLKQAIETLKGLQCNYDPEYWEYLEIEGVIEKIENYLFEATVKENCPDCNGTGQKYWNCECGPYLIHFVDCGRPAPPCSVCNGTGNKVSAEK